MASQTAKRVLVVAGESLMGSMQSDAFLTNPVLHRPRKWFWDRGGDSVSPGIGTLYQVFTDNVLSDASSPRMDILLP